MSTSTKGARSAPARIDEYSTFSKLTDVSGTTLLGAWHIVRGVGDLGYASVAFAQDERTGAVVPLGAVVRLEV